MKKLNAKSKTTPNVTDEDTATVKSANVAKRGRGRGGRVAKKRPVTRRQKNVEVDSAALLEEEEDDDASMMNVEQSRVESRPMDATSSEEAANDNETAEITLEMHVDENASGVDEKANKTNRPIEVKREEASTDNASSQNSAKESEDDDNDSDDDNNEGDEDQTKNRNKRATRTNQTAKRSRKVKEVLIPQMVVSKDRDSYTCLICSVENKFVADARGIVAHVKDEHNMRLYICDMCGSEFLKRSEMSKHMDEHITNEDDTFECDVCQRTFNNFRLYRVHKKMHNSSQKNYTCEMCGKRFGSRNLLEEHNNIHTGERPYCCSSCGKSFTSKYTLKSHEKTHEERPRPFSCINCGKAFLTQQNLIHHERIHSGIKNYICQECGKSFNTARNLETHCVIHTGYKPFICRLCGKAFSRKPEIRDHERTHTGEKPYQCEFCGASFGQRSNLQSHKRTTHYDDKRYKCTDCGRAFKRRRLLDYHMKAAHTGERPYKCVVCLATFIYPEHFKKHKLIHTGEKPYECEVCGKAFNSRDNRNAHRFVHSDKKPYECLVCGMGFMRKPLLYNHMNAAGHQNDTIVVNQPRLTTEEVIVDTGSTTTTVASTSTTTTATTIEPSQLEMTIITADDGNQKFVPISALKQDDSDDQKVYFHGLKEQHIIIPDEHDDNQQHNLHIVMDGQVEVHYASQHDLDAMQQGGNAIVSEEIQITSDGSTVVVPRSEGGTIAYASEPTTIKTDGGSIQIVQIRLAEDSDEQKQWIDLLQAQQQN